MLRSRKESTRDEDQQRYGRAQERVEALKGFYIHAIAFALVNIALFAINVLVGGRGTRPGCVRPRRQRTLGQK